MLCYAILRLPFQRHLHWLFRFEKAWPIHHEVESCGLLMHLTLDKDLSTE